MTINGDVWISKLKQLLFKTYTIKTTNFKGISVSGKLVEPGLLESLSKRQVSLLLLIDFSKAFDMVEHPILIDKLEHYGIRGPALKWLKSYLSNRKQFVSLNGCNSSTLTMEYGVPQGSILGPLLFIIYINDIPDLADFATFILYADDANIILTANTIEEISNQLKMLILNLQQWVNSNGLALN